MQAEPLFRTPLSLSLSLTIIYILLPLPFPFFPVNLIVGWINAYTEGGWLPKWGSPGYRGGMTGSMGDNALGDAIVKREVIDKYYPGLNYNTAMKALLQDALTIPPNAATSDDRYWGVGRVALKSYLEHGYIAYGDNGTSPPTEPVDQIVSRALNYYLSDYAIGLAAKSLGEADEDDAMRSHLGTISDDMLARAANYSKLLEPNTKFMRVRNPDGTFLEPFDEFGWGPPGYTEGGPWQYRFYAPHDALGLATLYGDGDASSSNLCDMLQNAQTTPSIYHFGGYGHEIHEMSEMALYCWGQYEHDNQPVHHMLWMFIASDRDGVGGKCAQKGQAWIRKAMTELYVPGTTDGAMFAGDEDNGQLAAWLVLAASGLYQLAPGNTHYTLGTPLFESVTLHIGGKGYNGKAGATTINIVAHAGIYLFHWIV